MTWRVDSGLRRSFFISDCELMLQAKADRDELSGMLGMGWNGSISAVPTPKRDQERFVLQWATCGWCVDCAWGPLKVLIETSVHLLMWDRNFNGWLAFIFTSMKFLWISCEGRTHKWRVSLFSLKTDLASVLGRVKILNKACLDPLQKCHSAWVAGMWLSVGMWAQNNRCQTAPYLTSHLPELTPLSNVIILSLEQWFSNLLSHRQSHDERQAKLFCGSVEGSSS